MSNPGESAAAQSVANTTESFEQEVNSVVKQLTKREDGTMVLPKDLKVSAEVKYAATLEKRRRDTESALGKTRQQLKTEETVRKELEKRVTAKVGLSLAPEDAEVLDDLMVSDPEAWRKKINELEQVATTELTKDLAKLVSTASQQTEQDRRAQVLEQFNKEHPDAPVTDQALVNDIPPRITRKLEEGKITFEEFLQESNDFLVSPKVIGDISVPKVTDIGLTGGSSSPSDDALANQNETDYAHTVF